MPGYHGWGRESSSVLKFFEEAENRGMVLWEQGRGARRAPSLQS